MSVAKLFVGQVPRTVSEEDLTPLFSPFGTLQEVAIIRDRSTQMSKGCAFVIFSSKEEADACIAALHNQHQYPGMPSPLQISYAGSGGPGGGVGGAGGGAGGAPGESKLFLGMLPKTSTEQDLMPIFTPFGEINELAILKAPDGSSKGCGFLRYKEVSSAMAAIKALDGVVKLPGSPAPLCVKFAESNAQKQKMASAAMNPLASLGLGLGGGLGAQMLTQPAYWQQLQQQLVQQQQAQSRLQQQLVQQQQMAQQLTQQVAQQYTNPAAAYASYLNPTASATGGLNSPNLTAGTPGMDLTGLAGISGLGALSAAGLSGTGYAANGFSASGYGGAAGGLGAQYAGLTGSGGFSGASSLYSGVPAATAQGFSAPGSALGSNKEGPPGANLFVYHLPREYTDAELMTLFSPFGAILSCKVVTEKDTGVSRGYGFVSYETADSASLAISQMNGFLVTGGRRLKVEVKSQRGAPGAPGGGAGFRPY